MAISAGDHGTARLWSRAIYEAYPDVHGVWYGSAMHANAPSVALYERAEGSMPLSPEFDEPLSSPALAAVVARAVRELGYDVA